MYKIDTLAELNRVGCSNAAKLATLSLAQIERLMKLNMGAAKSVLAGGAKNADAVAGVKDIPSLFALNAELTAANVDALFGYSRGVYGLGSEGQSELSALADQAWTDYTKRVAAWVEEAGKSAPAGSESAVNVVKSTLAATTTAFDQISRATKEVAGFFDASARAATANAASMAKSAVSYASAV